MLTVKTMRAVAKQAGVSAEILRQGSGAINVWLKSENDANIFNAALNSIELQLNRQPLPFIGGVIPSTVKFTISGKAVA